MLPEALSFVYRSRRVLADLLQPSFQSLSWLHIDPSFLHDTVALIQASWILSPPWSLVREGNPEVVQGFELSLCVIMLFALSLNPFCLLNPIIEYTKGQIHELIYGVLGL